MFNLAMAYQQLNKMGSKFDSKHAFKIAQIQLPCTFKELKEKTSIKHKVTTFFCA